jgi:hypothetical protein
MNKKTVGTHLKPCGDGGMLEVVVKEVVVMFMFVVMVVGCDGSTCPYLCAVSLNHLCLPSFMHQPLLVHAALTLILTLITIPPIQSQLAI